MSEPTINYEIPKKPLKWYQGLDRYCWVVLVIAALGWLFDTMDQNLFNLVRTQSIKDLLGERGKDAAHVKAVGGWVTAAFLIGWSVGGFIFGIIGDRLGRTTTMILTILIYAVFTGLSGLAWDPWSYGFFRFMTGLGVGGEWAAGAALVAEVFPSRSRPMALGMLQALSAVGNMMAAVITFTLAGMSWRWAYAVGAAPALLVLWIRRSVHEPEKWKEAKERASFGKEMGNITELITDPTLRRNTIAALLMAVAGQGALWGIGFWSVDHLLSVLAPYNLAKGDVDRTKSVMFFVQQFGAMIGIYLFAAFSERTSRRAAFTLWFALAWVSIPCFFYGVARSTNISLGGLSSILGPITFSSGLPAGAQSAFQVSLFLAFFMGFATLGPFSGFTVYFPELYPTRLRATGCGICYNGGRFLAAVVPILTTALAATLARKGAIANGYPAAATIFSCIYLLGFLGTFLGPETRGKPLPEEAPPAEGVHGGVPVAKDKEPVPQ
jgi:predicted MFS family arabinose efflux permease